MSEVLPGPTPLPEGIGHGAFGVSRRPADAITCHRLGALSLDASALLRLPGRARAEVVYRRMVARVPFENLSNQRSCRERPGDPDRWPRATDRFLREHRTEGLGGTCFTLAYALRDLLNGIGVTAHLVVGRNLVTEELHAATLACPDGEGPLLLDPSLLTTGAVRAQAGAVCEEPLGRVHVEDGHGGSLTVFLTLPGVPRPRPILSVSARPTPPHRFRQAWVASFCRGREDPLRLARREGDEIRRWSERPGRLEVLKPDGREQHALEGAPVTELSRLFGIGASCLERYFASR